MSDFQMWVCRTGKHNKFWTYQITQDDSGYVFTSKYGRIGGRVNKSSKGFGSRWSAEAWASKKLDEKYRKGYDDIGEDEFKLLCVQAEIVGTGNKIESMAIVSDRSKALVKMTPAQMADPDAHPMIAVIMRKRDKDGATAPFVLLFDENSAYFLAGRDPNWRPTTVGGTFPTITYSLKKKIEKGHELFPMVEKAMEAAGTLF
jgi:predicted DNA-binding WGR domain protein